MLAPSSHARPAEEPRRSPLAAQAYDALQIKRAADQAYFRDVIKRQRRCLELLHDAV